MTVYRPQLSALTVAVFVLVWLVLLTRCSCADRVLAAANAAGLLGEWALINALCHRSQFGTTLGSIGTVIGLGVMMGRCCGGFRRGGAWRALSNGWKRRESGRWRSRVAYCPASPFSSIRFCHSLSGGSAGEKQ